MTDQPQITIRELLAVNRERRRRYVRYYGIKEQTDRYKPTAFNKHLLVALEHEYKQADDLWEKSLAEFLTYRF